MKILLALCRVLSLNFVLVFNLTAQWTRTSFPDSIEVRSLIRCDSNFYAGGYRSGVFLSTDKGKSWENTTVGQNDTFITSLAVLGTNLFAGNGRFAGPTAGVIRSTNNGETWTAANGGLSHRNVLSLGVKGTNLFAGTSSGVYYSTNNGMSWTSSTLRAYNTLAFAEIGTTFFAGTNAGVWQSVNNGVSWTWLSNLGITVVRALAVHGTKLFAATEGDGIFLSSDNGMTWGSVNSGLSELWISSLAVSDTNLYAGTSDGVFLSTNFGKSWTNVNQNLIGTAFAFTIIDTNLFAGTIRGIWKRSLHEIVTTVKGPPVTTLDHPELIQNFPNPFNPTTTIRYNLHHTSFVTLTIHNSLGQQVARLVNEQMGPGIFSSEWNAENVASGVYYYRLQTEDFVQTKKLILLR